MIPVSKDKIEEYTSKGWWGEETILDLMFQSASHTPDNIALVDPYNKEQLLGAGGQLKQLTHQELIQSVDRIALHLMSLGIDRNEVILIQLPNIVESVVTLCAAARIGAIASPLPMQARSYELSHAVEQTDARLMVTVSSFHGYDYLSMMQKVQENNPGLEYVVSVAPDKVPEGILSYEDMLQDPIENRYSSELLNDKQSGPNEVFTLCWTSGTEAEPKGVPRTHNQWISIASTVVEGAQIHPQANIIGSFPVINMAGIGGLMVPWILTGGKFVLHHPFDMETFFSQLVNEEIYYTLMPPALLDSLANSQKVEALKKSTLEVVASGSVPLSPWMVKFYQEQCNIGIVNLFASNEGVALFSAPKFFPDPEDRAMYFPRFGGEGVDFDLPEQIIGGIQSKLTDPTNGDQVITENGRIGELGFAGPTVFSGYWKRPDLTEKAFDGDGFYKSGDLFSIEGENQEKYLFHGRLKDLIIRGGYNISPDEIEYLISGHPKIKEASVVGVPDKRLGEIVGVAVVPAENEEITLEMINQYLDEQGVAKYKKPEKIKILDELPRNPVQKVLRRSVKEILAEE